MMTTTKMNSEDWCFDDPPNTACIIHVLCLSGEKPILFVSHDEDDGMWQFMPGDVALSEADARVVALEKAALVDPAVNEVANLPLGASASRSSESDNWAVHPPF